MDKTDAAKQRSDIERLENQVGQLTRIIANVNERLNYLETVSTNPFLIPSNLKRT